MSDYWRELTIYFFGVAIGAGIATFCTDSPRDLTEWVTGTFAIWLLGSLCYYLGKKAGRTQ